MEDQHWKKFALKKLNHAPSMVYRLQSLTVRRKKLVRSVPGEHADLASREPGELVLLREFLNQPEILKALASML